MNLSGYGIAPVQPLLAGVASPTDRLRSYSSSTCGLGDCHGTVGEWSFPISCRFEFPCREEVAIHSMISMYIVVELLWKEQPRQFSYVEAATVLGRREARSLRRHIEAFTPERDV